jgi:polyhydroxybutyrate depolymerase
MASSLRHPLRTLAAVLGVAIAFGCTEADDGGPGTAGGAGGSGGTTGGTGGSGGSGAGTGGANATGGAGSPGTGGQSGSGGTGGTGGVTGGAGGSAGVATSGGSAGASAGTAGASAGSGGDGAAGSGGDAGSNGAGRSGAAGSAGSGGASGSGTGGTGGAATVAGCGVSDPLESGRTSIDVGGSMREYILRVPDDYDGTKPHKLIFAFHARGGAATQVAGGSNNDYYGLFARSGGSAIFVSPEGLDMGWRNTDGRDIAFVKAMIARFESKLCIDKQRIFSTGFSFGGMMSDAIGCAMADVFRAIAPMAGGIPNDEHPYSGCDQVNDHPIAVWMAHGDNDTVVPNPDGRDALAIFVERAGCTQQTMPVTPSPCVAYQGCMPDYPIHWCEFSGGHMVPSFASGAIWDFFDQF